MPAIKITPLKHGTGNTTFRVSGTVNGKRRRERVKTDGEALTLKQNWEREAANMAALPTVTTRLTDAQCQEAELCFGMLAGAGYSLKVAVDFALANYKPTLNSIAIADAIAGFLTAKRAANAAKWRGSTARLRWLDDLETLLTAFAKTVGAKLVKDVLTGGLAVNAVLASHVERFALVEGLSARTQINKRTRLAVFFGWCKSKGFCAVSPVEAVAAPQAKGRTKPAVLTLGQCRALVSAALAYKEGRTVPFFVAALFGGVRPTECSRLNWHLVQWEPVKRFDIGPDVSKTGADERYTSVLPNMAEWLEPHRLKQTPFKITRYDFEAVRAKANLLDSGWDDDIMRHTAVSMFMAQFNDSAEAVKRHGHSVGVMMKHYMHRRTAEDAAEFWQLTPANVLAGPAIDLKQHAA